MLIMRGDVEMSKSSFYVLQVSLFSWMPSGSMNGGVWICLVG
jgi:hypothetical protein